MTRTIVMTPARENLTIYREIATALRFAYMNHEQRGKQLSDLKEMLFQDREQYDECDYRNTLNTLIRLIDFANASGLHSEVKSRLRLFETVCNNALSRPSSIFEERRSKDMEQDHLDRFNAHLDSLPTPDDPDFIPF